MIFKFNIPYLKKWAREIYNPGQDYNFYDNTLPLDWNVDAFASWFIGKALDHANVTNLLTEKAFGIKRGQKLNSLLVQNDGSGLNGDHYWKIHGSVKSALYDVWTDLKPKLLNNRNESMKPKSVKLIESIVRKQLNESSDEIDRMDIPK